MIEHLTSAVDWIWYTLPRILESILGSIRSLLNCMSSNWRWVLLFIVVVAVGVILIGGYHVSREQTKVGGRCNPRRRAVGKTPNGLTSGRDRVKDLSKHPRTKSEALAVNILEKIMGVSFPTVNPDWLRVVENGSSHTIELDGYNADVGVALEFSGPLHTKWSPSIETYESYLRRVILDQAKIELCNKRGICLIVIDMTLPRTHWRNYIASRLQDCGKLPVDRTVYFQYVDAQTAVPYRDEILEKTVKVDIKW